MSDHTFTLTAAERAVSERTLERGRFFDPLQKVTLEARLRTGWRVGSVADKGAMIVVLTGYRLNAKGQPTGTAVIRELSGRLSDAEAVAFIAQLESPRG